MANGQWLFNKSTSQKVNLSKSHFVIFKCVLLQRGLELSIPSIPCVPCSEIIIKKIGVRREMGTDFAVVWVG